MENLIQWKGGGGGEDSARHPPKCGDLGEIYHLSENDNRTGGIIRNRMGS